MAEREKPKDEEPKPEGQPEAAAEEDKGAEGPQVPCLHGSHDGQACCAMDCLVADVPAQIEELVRRKKAADGATMEFAAKLKGATINADGELTIAVTPNVDDQWALHRATVGCKGRKVAVFLAFAAEEDSGALPGQQAMEFEGSPQLEPIEVIACATCRRIDRSEGVEPGRVCAGCLDGELVMQTVAPLVCSNCKQAPELSTALPGDSCTLCKEGRYMAVEPVIDSCGDLVRFIPPDRVEEIADAVCGLTIQNDRQAKAIIAVGDDRFVITETTGSDPISFEAWRAVPMDEFGDAYHDDGTNLDCLRVTLGADGAAFVLVGPAVRLVVQPEDEEPSAEETGSGDEPAEGEGD